MKLRLALLSLVCCACVSRVVPIEEERFAESLGVDLSQSTKLESGLYLRDLVAGDGGAAMTGERIAVNYVGYFVDGSEFDRSTAPFVFTIGAGEVIAGWDQGVPGLRPGGVRQLIIPPSLGYGEAGAGPIPGNANIVFTVSRP